jgi:hypothetical protein
VRKRRQAQPEFRIRNQEAGMKASATEKTEEKGNSKSTARNRCATMADLKIGRYMTQEEPKMTAA